jgi:hypothetical protein
MGNGILVEQEKYYPPLGKSVPIPMPDLDPGSLCQGHDPLLAHIDGAKSQRENRTSGQPLFGKRIAMGKNCGSTAFLSTANDQKLDARN